MIGMEKIIFLALKVVHPWQIKIEFENGFGEILVDSKKIVWSKLTIGEKVSEGVDAFKKLIRNQSKIKKLDIFPVGKIEKKNMDFNVHKVMELIETIAIEQPENAKNWIDEFLLNLISLDTNWIVNLQGTTFKGKLYLYNRQYIDAFFIDKLTKEKKNGEEAFKAIIHNKDKIETTELLPLKEQPEIKFKKNFVELLNVINE